MTFLPSCPNWRCLLVNAQCWIWFANPQQMFARHQDPGSIEVWGDMWRVTFVPLTCHTLTISNKREENQPGWHQWLNRQVKRRVMNILQLPIWVQLRNYPRSLMLPRQYSPLAHHPYTSINNTFHHQRQSVKLTEWTVTLTPPPAGSLPNCTPFYNRNVLANPSLWLGLSPSSQHSIMRWTAVKRERHHHLLRGNQEWAINMALRCGPLLKK